MRTEEEKRVAFIEASLRWREKNLDKFKAYQKEYREKNPEKALAWSRRNHRRNIQNQIEEYFNSITDTTGYSTDKIMCIFLSDDGETYRVMQIKMNGENIDGYDIELKFKMLSTTTLKNYNQLIGIYQLRGDFSSAFNAIKWMNYDHKVSTSQFKVDGFDLECIDGIARRIESLESKF